MISVVAIDTAGPVLGVAAWSGGRLAVRTERVTRGGERLLVPWIAEACAEIGLEPFAVDAVVVADGPGAFTGLRVGLATAAGLALARRVPVVPIGALVSRGRAVSAGAPVLAWLDARKGRAYAQAFATDGASVHGPDDIDPDEALSWMAPGFVATGEGCLVWGERVLAAGGRTAPFADEPGVATLALLGAESLAAGGGVDPGAVVPRYVRRPDAVARAGRDR